MSPIIIDLILLLILILFMYTGFRKGLISTLAGLLSFIIALVGANLLARACTPTVANWIAPSIETALVEKIQTTPDPQDTTSSVSPSSEYTESTSNPHSDGETDQTMSEENSLISVLQQLGLYDSVTQYITDATEQQVTAAGTSIAKILSLSLASLVAFWVLFLLFLILLRIVLGILVRGLNLVARLPVLHQLNHIGGLLIGLLQGIVVLFLIACLLPLLGPWIPENVMEQTILLRLLTHTNPFALFPALST